MTSIHTISGQGFQFVTQTTSDIYLTASLKTPLTPAEQSIVALPIFQGLKGIGQMEARHVAHCSGLTHTRYEHSLATLYWASLIADKLNLPADQRAIVRISALVHDIFHIAYSHTLEKLAESQLGHHHDYRHEQLFKQSGLWHALERYSIDPHSIIQALATTGKSIQSLGNLSKGLADRIEYICRDLSMSAAHPSVKQDVLDLSYKLIDRLILHEGIASFTTAALPIIIKLMRYRSYSFAEQAAHPKARVFCTRLYRAVRDLLQHTKDSQGEAAHQALCQQICTFKDKELLQLVTDKSPTKLLADNGFIDPLIEPAFALCLGDLEQQHIDKILDGNKDPFTKIVQKALEDIGIPYGEHFITIPPVHFLKPVPFPVLVNDEVKLLEVGGDYSRTHTYVAVYVKSEYRDKIRQCESAIAQALGRSELVGIEKAPNQAGKVMGRIVDELYSPIS